MRIQNRNQRSLIFTLFLTLITGLTAMAQAPTSLKYPSSVVSITNFSNVYLAPTVSGNVATYTINPVLPAGLTLAANTGIITGTPTVASPATTYTVTATNASGFTTTTFSLQVTTSYFDNAYGQLRFTGTLTPITGTTGRVNGDRMLYKNVATISGTQIDCIITTIAQQNAQWQAYDQEAVSGDYFDSNSPNFFSPQFNFTAAGFVSFNFQFILGNSYNATTATNGIPVTLQNVYINTYDIDGNGDDRQYNSFSGFDSYQLGNPTIEEVLYDGTYASTRFRSTSSTNYSTVTDPRTRVRTAYKNVSSFPIVVGANGGGANPNGLAFFFLDFSSGSAFTTNSIQAPSLDLNTATIGVNNAGLNCGGAMNFTTTGTNYNTGSPNATKVEISFPTADIKDAAAEQIIVNGATGTGPTRSLDANGVSATAIIDGITWTITGAIVGTSRVLTFTPNTAATPTQTETLLDALQYRNTATAATNGTRNFTVNVSNATMVSPDAVFSAEVNCVKIRGSIFRDANGLSDNTVNASGTQLLANGAYAVLTNASNTVLATVGVSAGGAYDFGTRAPGAYNIYISNTATPPATVNASTYPNSNGQSFVSTGENFGTGTGTDGLADGKIMLTVGSASVDNANFGIELPPTTANSTISGVINPGGYNFYTIPTSGGFSHADQDGTVSSITITSFPTGANYIRLNGIIYTNASGSTCPPQSSCTTWPGSVIVPVANISAIAIDPLAVTGTTSIVIPFRATDNANVTDVTPTPSSLTVNFAAPAANTISGYVWNDANSNGVKVAIEPYVAPAEAGQKLYALLVQTTNTYSTALTVYASAEVATVATGYAFTNIPSGNQYEVRLASLTAAPSDGVALSTISQALATGWVGVSYYNNNAVVASGLNTTAPVIALGVVAGNKPNVNFGLDALPTAQSNTAVAQLNPGGTTSAVVPATTFSGTDNINGEIKYVHITAFPTNVTSLTVIGSTTAGGSPTTLVYNTLGAFPAGGVYIATTPNGNLLNSNAVSVDPVNGAVTAVISYKVIDNLGLESTNSATASQPFTFPSISGNVYNDVNGLTDNLINGSGTNTGNTLYVNAISGGTVVKSAIVSASGAYTLTEINGGTYNLVLTTTATGTTAALPAGWVNTGEGTGTGSDGAVNGSISVTITNSNITNRNFGIEALPTAQVNTVASQVNPGGTNMVALPVTAFSGIDNDLAGGQINYVHLTAFPTNATSIMVTGAASIGGAVNTNTYSQSSFPGTGIYIATTSNGNLANNNAIMVDPIDGAVTTSLTYKVIDNANLSSTATATASQPFTTLGISGTVYNDFNGLTDNQINGPATNVGATLYVNAVSGGVVRGSALVAANGSYTISNMYAGNYNLVLTTSATSTTPATPAGYVNTAEGGGKNSDGTVNGTINVSLATSNISDQNFGIEAPAIADGKAYFMSSVNNSQLQVVSVVSSADNANKYVAKVSLIGNASSGAVAGLLTGVDPDGNNGSPISLSASASGVSLIIDPASYNGTYNGTVASDVMMITYSGIQLQPGGCKGSDIGNANCALFNTATAKWEIPAYDQAQLSLLLKNGTSEFNFKYAWKDAAAVTGSPSTYFVQFATPLPLKLDVFTARANNEGQVKLNWHTLDEVNTLSFEVEHSLNGNQYNKIGTVAAQGNAASGAYSFLHQSPAKGNNYYRLKMMDQDGKFTYSPIRLVQINKQLESNFMLTPNPAISGYTNIVWAGSIDESVQVYVYDGNGKQVFSSVMKNTNLLKLNTTGWSNGIYQVLLSQGGKAITKKLSVQ